MGTVRNIIIIAVLEDGEKHQVLFTNSFTSDRVINAIIKSEGSIHLREEQPKNINDFTEGVVRINTKKEEK